MRIPVLLRFMFVGILGLILASVVSAFAAGLSVPASNIGKQTIPITLADIKPDACQGLYLTNIVRGSGTITGTSGNDLIIGSAGPDSIDGLEGDDCILGGQGDDEITGGEGTDVCLGGPGTENFLDCETQIP
jgi:hypothetical protein